MALLFQHVKVVDVVSGVSVKARLLEIAHVTVRLAGMWGDSVAIARGDDYGTNMPYSAG